MGGDVLVSGSLVGVGAGGVLAVGHHSPEVTPPELLLAGVAVVDGDEEAALDDPGNRRQLSLRLEGNLGAVAGLGVNPIAVEEFEFGGGGRGPFLKEPPVFQVDAEGAVGGEDVHRERVEKFICEDDAWDLGDQSSALSLSRVEVRERRSSARQVPA